MSARIAVVGSLNMDLVIRAEHIPEPGETILGSDFQTIPGGKGANQAVAAARLGAEVSMVGRLGNDSFADILLDNLAAYGIATSHVIKDALAPSGVALIVVDQAGENSIVVASGANMQVSEADVEAAQAVIAGADVLILQLEIPLPAVQRAARIAADHAVPVLLNPAPARELPVELLPLVNVMIPNETETALLTGQRTDSEAGLEEATLKLLQQGVGAVVITLGKKGAYIAGQEQKGQFSRAFSINPVDTTAAGDAFVAGLAVHLAEGHSLEQAVTWGNAAGALAALRFGAQTSAPSREEVEMLIAGVAPDKIIGKAR